ncbi:MAG: extensin family protein [Myxococcota bacterium]
MRNILLIFILNLIIFPGILQAKKKKKMDQWCLHELKVAKVQYKIGPQKKGLVTPVRITNGKIGPIQYKNGSKDARPLMDCRTALALYRIYPILRANGGIKEVYVGKFYSYRYVKNSSRLSRHASGHALDIYGVKLDDGKKYTIKDDYETGLGSGKTCLGKPKTRGARILRQLACDLDWSHYFRNILTPDSDPDHRNHFHISVYRRGEAKKRKYRTVLLEPAHYHKKWVRRHSLKGYPCIKRVWMVVNARRSANRRLIRRMQRQKRRKKRKKK